MLIDIAKMQAEHDAKLAEATRANEIAASLPLAPRSVMFATTSLPWVSYSVKTLADALDIFRLYTPAPFVVAKNGGCTVLGPWGYIEERYNVDHPAKTNYRPYEVEFEIPDGAPSIECSAGQGYRSEELEFFTVHNGVLLKVGVRMEQCPIRVYVVALNAAHNCRKFRKDYPTVPGANTIRWDYGEESAKATYWFSDLDTFWASMGTYVPGTTAL